MVGATHKVNNLKTVFFFCRLLIPTVSSDFQDVKKELVNGCVVFFFFKSGEPQEIQSMEKIHASVLLASVKIMATLFPGLGWKD